MYLRQFPSSYNHDRLSQERPVKFPWVHTIEELNISSLYAPIMHQIGRAYEVSPTLTFVQATIDALAWQEAGDTVPLREFALNASFATTCVEPEENRPTLEDVIHYLRKAKLEKLILYHVYNLSVNQLEMIIDTFPLLRQLTLYSDRFSARTYSNGGVFVSKLSFLNIFGAYSLFSGGLRRSHQERT